MALSGAVDLVSNDRPQVAALNSLRRNPLAATISQPKLTTPYPQMGCFSDFCKISVTSR